jgi:hypothetical protein
LPASERLLRMGRISTLTVTKLVSTTTTLLGTVRGTRMLRSSVTLLMVMGSVLTKLGRLSSTDVGPASVTVWGRTETLPRR